MVLYIIKGQTSKSTSCLPNYCTVPSFSQHASDTKRQPAKVYCPSVLPLSIRDACPDRASHCSVRRRFDGTDALANEGVFSHQSSASPGTVHDRQWELNTPLKESFLFLLCVLLFGQQSSSRKLVFFPRSWNSERVQDLLGT